MKLSDFDYILPQSRIALQPANPKHLAKMLVVNLEGAFTDDIVANFANYLQAGDLVIFNNSKVIPAKFLVRKAGSEAVISINLHKRKDVGVWSAFARPGKKLQVGDKLYPLGAEKQLEVKAKHDDGQIIIDFHMDDTEFYSFVEMYGQTPLPPYIEKQHKTSQEDKELYQTIYAKDPGSVAAPTAGLHFTEELFAALKAKNIEYDFITLHVGGGTFLPVKTENLAEHKMHSELVYVSHEVAQKINEVKKRGGRIIAVGTTSARTLEYATNKAGYIEPYQGEVDLFITPGYRFKLVDMLLTNFHLPKSTLLMLVSAFAGYDRIKVAYEHAIASDYRFYSYGDCCLLYREDDVDK